jgi:hypothetical protein
MRIIFEKIINLYYGSKDDIESKFKFNKRSKKLKKKRSKLTYRRTHVLNSNTFYHYSFLDSTWVDNYTKKKINCTRG